MASKSDYSASDDNSSSLGDSAYDFVDDKSGIVSDDEEHENLTHSVSSTDDRELSRLHRQSCQSIEYDTSGITTSRQSPSFSHSLVGAYSSSTGSGFTIRGRDERNGGQVTDHREDEEDVIVLREPLAMNKYPDKPCEGECIVKVFDQDEAGEIAMLHVRDKTPLTTLTVVVKQSMVTSRLTPPNPYRVVFIGDPSAREEIVWKIGSALDASSIAEYASNQYTVVRIPSFEDTTARGVELINSTGISLIVEECISATFTKAEGGNDTISMTVANQGSNQKLVESVWSGPGHRITENWSLPDLAIFYLSESDNITHRQTRHFARKFMSRHQVACIVISQAPFWKRPAEIIALDYTTPHICLKAHESATSIMKRLPVDLETFMKLDASQMNRHLAYLAKRNPSSQPKFSRRAISGQEVSGDLLADGDGYFSSPSIRHIKEFLSSTHSRSLKRIVFTCLLFVLGFVVYQPLTAFTVRAPHVSLRHQEKGINLVANVPTACAQFGPAEPISLQIKSALSMGPVSSSINKASDLGGKSPWTSNAALASLLHDRPDFTSNASEGFEVGIIGDYHIVLRSPRWFTRSKKSPKLAFNVTRKGVSLRHQASMPFNGVYALEIPKEDAYGNLNVSLRTISKPVVKESFEVEFGSSWWKKSTLIKAKKIISIPMDLDQDGLFASTMGRLHRFAIKFGHMMSWRSGRVDEARRHERKAPRVEPIQTRKTADTLRSKVTLLTPTLWRRLNDGSRKISEQVISQALYLRRGIKDCSMNTSRLMLEGKEQLSHVIVGNYQNIVHHIVRVPKRHLRTTQKEVLKFWWRFSGLPKQAQMKRSDTGASHTWSGGFLKKFRR